MGLRRHYHEPSTPNFDKFELGLIGMHISLTHQRKSVEVLMLQLRASGVGVMLHLSLKNVIGQRRRVARSNTTQSVAGSTRHNRWVGAILADMNIPFITTHFSFSNFSERPSSITSIYILKQVIAASNAYVHQEGHVIAIIRTKNIGNEKNSDL